VFEQLTLTLAAELLAVGLAAGLLGGMLGIGGGIIMIPAMLLLVGEQRFGVESLHLYKLAAICTSIPMAIPACLRHYRARAIVPSLLRGILPGALLGVLVGVALTLLFVDEQTRWLRRIFGAFLQLAVLIALLEGWLSRGHEHGLVRRCPTGRRWWPYAAAVGLPAGITAGLLSVGGGVWAVPVQRMLLGVQLRNAIANSAVMILPVALVTTISQAVALDRALSIPIWPAFGLALCLVPGALVGSWCGASLTHKLPLRWLRTAFHVLLVVTGLRMMLQ
jgi:uncharacterized membrane protein YfcA